LFEDEEKMEPDLVGVFEFTSTMDYSTMSLVELKKQAKEARIKQYYVMKRAQLIELLSMDELPLTLRVEKMTIHQLREEAKKRSIKGVWDMTRGRLVEILFGEEINNAAADKNEENKSQTDEHHEPQKHDAKDVGV
jgi:hypothetical protein